MPLFKRKEENLIPPVPQSGNISTSPNSRPSYYSNASTYNASRDGDLYNNTEKDRHELLSGYNPEKVRLGRFLDGPQAGREPNSGEEDEEDVEGIKKQTRFVKQESVQSTRNALRMAREAEETARSTALRLGDQSEKLANTERHLDTAKSHSTRAADNADQLKQLNRSIFRPVITFNKDAKRAAQEAKIQERYDDERSERERTMMDIRESQNRLGRAATYARGVDDDDGGMLLTNVRDRYKKKDQLEQRKRYQFENTASDDDLEDELDKNLDEIGDVTKRLKALGTAMGHELDSQNERVDKIGDKADKVGNGLSLNTQRLKRIR